MPGQVAKFIDQKRGEGLSDEMIESLVNEKFKGIYVPVHTFTEGYVYDKKDVRPAPGKKQLDEWDTDLSNEQLYRQAKNFAMLKFKVVDDDKGEDIGRPSKARGYSSGGEIHILKVPGESKSALNTLLHEMSHEMLGHHQRKISREAKEMEAELCAYVVAKHYNIDLGKKAKAYIGSWYSPEKFNEENIDRVMKTAHDIIRGIDHANGRGA